VTPKGQGRDILPVIISIIIALLNMKLICFSLTIAVGFAFPLQFLVIVFGKMLSYSVMYVFTATLRVQIYCCVEITSITSITTAKMLPTTCVPTR